MNREPSAAKSPEATAAYTSPGGAEGAPPSSAPTSATAVAPPLTVDETLSDIDRLERDLNLAVQRLAQGPKVAQSEGVVPPSAQRPAQAPRASDRAAESEFAGGDPCLSACRALASMRRSVDHLCGLTGDGDSRCEGARTRVQGASERVRATCPACS
jgi:hypothetical protein